jgi:short-subunit dehydrogenase
MSIGKVLIVTGASSGIGRSLAEQAVRAGYNVVAVGRRTQRLDELERSLGMMAASLRTLTLDIRRHDAAKTIASTALDAFGRIDVLVNNAGTGSVGSLLKQNSAALREQLDTHLLAPLSLLRETYDALRTSHGQIFFIGSGVARVPVTGFGIYPSAKAAVRSLARIARMELKREGIAVTYVDPGAPVTEFHTRLGYSGPPSFIATTPEHVAQRILKAVKTRQRVVNAVGWQTFLVGLAEMLPVLTDTLMENASSLLGSKRLQTPAVLPAEQHAALPTPTISRPLDAQEQQPIPLERVLEPYERRMNTMNLPREFVRNLLTPNTELENADEIALQWAGMPNKHERALMRDILEALADAGFLERSNGERYRVKRANDVRDTAR